MINDFFTKALAAASKGPEIFALEFKNNEAKANIRKYGDWGDPLIHCVIKEIPDAVLPSILSILIQHGVDLKSRDLVSEEMPLSVAAGHLKKEAVKFLIEQKAEINDPLKPALCSVLINDHDVKLRLDIIKYLLQHGADVNIQDKYSLSPLCRAAATCSLEAINYLILQGANLFSKYNFACNTQHKTALGIAFEEFVSNARCFKENEPPTINAKSCLDVLICAAVKCLYRQAASLRKNDKDQLLYLNNQIDHLAGDFRHIAYGEVANSIRLKRILEKEVLQPVLMRIKKEKDQIHAFQMGSRLSATQRASNKQGPAIYRFFQKANTRHLTEMIFSFVHESTPYIKLSE